MSTLQIKKVFFKKRVGILEAKENSISWRDENEEKVSILIPVNQIEKQLENKVDPNPNQEKKPKIMLKLSLKNNAPDVTFTFASLKDREIVISFIKESTSTINAAQSATTTGPALTEAEIAARQKLLSSNPEWQVLHRDLVIKGRQLTEEEFWSSRKTLLEQQHFVSSQKRGTSSALLADINPEDGEGSDIKFTLNANIIHSIFTQYPGVHQAFLDHVPDKFSEKEFWTRYFSSKYFHRNRGATNKAQQDQDIFAPYMGQGENTALHPNLIFNSTNKLLDLTTTNDDHLETGNAPDTTMKAGSFKDALPLIRKFNRHSQLILDGLTGVREGKKQKTAHDFSSLFKKETEINDLEAEQEPSFVPISISDPSKYFKVPSSKSAKSSSPTKMRKTLAPHINPNLSLASFKDLQSDTAILSITSKNYTSAFYKVSIPDALFQESKLLHSSVFELVRHFWISISNPSTTSERLDRIGSSLDKMKKSVDSFITRIQDAGNREQCIGLLVNMKSCLEKALVRLSKDKK